MYTKGPAPTHSFTLNPFTQYKIQCKGMQIKIECIPGFVEISIYFYNRVPVHFISHRFHIKHIQSISNEIHIIVREKPFCTKVAYTYINTNISQITKTTYQYHNYKKN